MDLIYSFLSCLYGDELHDFLIGVNGMNDTNLFNVIWVYYLGDMMVDEDGENLTIGLTNIIGFGFASAILSSIVFFLASLVWKTQSTNCPSTPF